MLRYAFSMFGVLALSMSFSKQAMALPCPGTTTPEVETCLRSQLAQSQATLERYIVAATRRAYKENTTQASKAFSDAQAAWSTYRDNECAAVYSAWALGTIGNSMSLVCLRRLTEDRTHEIWHDWLTYPDSTPPVLPEPPIQLGRN